MRQIRLGVFETNSSSVHTLVIVSKEEFEKFYRGELFYDSYKDEFVTTPPEDEYDDVKTYETFFGDMEEFEERYTTKSGDEIVVFGYYGHDG